MPVDPSLTGMASVRVFVPAAVSGATKQLAMRRDRPDIASTTIVAAEASACGPDGHNAATRPARRRREGSSTRRVSANPAIVGYPTNWPVVANGRVYIGTYDGTLYCFGLDDAQRSQ